MENTLLPESFEYQSLEMCLKTFDHLGTTEHINICTGQTNIIPWGITGWMGFILFGLIIFGLLFLVIAVIRSFVSDF